jgi:hypothetical protein
MHGNIGERGLAEVEATSPAVRGRPFRPGQSGNTAGRPKGARNRATLLLEALLEGEAEEIGRKLIELAKQGDGRALKACLDRLLPAPRDRPVCFSLPPIDTAADVPKASAAILAAVAEGEITPSEAMKLARLLETHRRALKVHELGMRVARAEEERRTRTAAVLARSPSRGAAAPRAEAQEPQRAEVLPAPELEDSNVDGAQVEPREPGTRAPASARPVHVAAGAPADPPVMQGNVEGPFRPASPGAPDPSGCIPAVFAANAGRLDVPRPCPGIRRPWPPWPPTAIEARMGNASGSG